MPQSLGEGNMDKRKENLRLSTAAIHAGFKIRDSYGAAAEPMFPSSTYTFSSAEAAAAAFQNPFGETSEYIYSRVTHPNAVMLEDRLSAIEPGAGEAAIFSSGLAAIYTTLVTHLPKGGRLVCLNPVYGGTHHQLESFFKSNPQYAYSEFDARQQEWSFPPDTALVFFEAPTNPTLTVIDIDAVARAAKKANPDALVMVDNTFMGALQTPFLVSSFVDLVVYSCTKFMGGHSNVLSGAVVARKGRDDLAKRVKETRVALGNILAPFECWQLLNAIKTYALRMRIQAKGAQRLAEALVGHPLLERVNYPTLWDPKAKDRQVFEKQCTDPGAIVGLYFRDFDRSRIFRFLNILKERHHILLAVSLGGVESLICHPATTTHACLSEADRQKYGIAENLLRLSVGLEEPDVLIEDLRYALGRA
jgi:cystathionine beta-lyase/cystathionine gamma-synthase